MSSAAQGIQGDNDGDVDGVGLDFTTEPQFAAQCLDGATLRTKVLATSTAGFKVIIADHLAVFFTDVAGIGFLEKPACLIVEDIVEFRLIHFTGRLLFGLLGLRAFRFNLPVRRQMR
jgi:hypothetical protein